MPEAWKQWVGQIVNSRFVLRQYLGGSRHSAVFLTERQNAAFDKAAIKLIHADPDTTDFHLARWRDVAQLSHAHLLKLFHYGQCKLDGLDLLYTVSELADEDLAQILPTRALNALETREVVLQIGDALSYLHAANFVHRRVCPVNILAAGDEIKLSSDSVCRSSESAFEDLTRTVYDAPEIAAAGARVRRTPAADVYSLAVSFVEALTQRVPQPDRAVPPLTAPFDELAERALNPDPELRWTAADIMNRLNARAAAPPPVPSDEAVPASAGLPPAARAAVAPRTANPGSPGPPPARVAARPEKQVSGAAPPPRQITAEALSSYQVPSPFEPDQIPLSPVEPVVMRRPRGSNLLFPIGAAAVLLLALLLIPKLMHRTEAQPDLRPAALEAPAAAQSGKQAAPAPAAAEHDRQPSASRETLAIRSTPEKPAVASPAPGSAPNPSPPSDSGSAVEPSPAAERPATREAHPDGVTQKYLPDVAQKALNTIHGTVRVGVRVAVSPAGSVESTELADPSGSDFFNKAALEAAKRWQFRKDSSADRRSWVLHFAFTPSTIRASADPAG